ncbi:MAG TPA: hypothetical protein VJT50_12765 [Pyrinomonadaceae bacterium]|nr:hypothetical protein [Pyrinomonadaceae bacterium]
MAAAFSLETIKVLLTVISGVCWTIVYVLAIRVGLKDKSYAIPFYALALNFAWELLYTFYGFKINGLNVQNVFSAIWLTFDVGILYTYFKYGQKYFRSLVINSNAFGARRDHSATTDGTDLITERCVFVLWSVLGLVTALLVEYAIRREFGVAKGAGYSAFRQNLLMSILFITMLVRRGGTEGQSMPIAVNKWIGTLAPTILYGIVGEGGFPHGSLFIVITGGLCSVFDLIYICLFARVRRGLLI